MVSTRTRLCPNCDTVLEEEIGYLQDKRDKRVLRRVVFRYCPACDAMEPDCADHYEERDQG